MDDTKTDDVVEEATDEPSTDADAPAEAEGEVVA